jgi:hypothetical protein
MYLTEEEARGYHCPEIAEGRGFYIETGKPQPASACMASACPKWRYYEHNPDSSIGYCGGGGKP